eukprot:m.108394 g.108394  ORF g.108394 m.108394 type:complete len:261 (+) comp15866_c0_seq1:111-893(+)
MPPKDRKRAKTEEEETDEHATTANAASASAGAAGAAGAAGSSSGGLSKIDEMKQRLEALKAKRETAREENRAEAAEEDKKSKLPKNYDARKRRAEEEEEEERRRKEAEAEGVDYDRVKHLQMTADVTERVYRDKDKHYEVGFSDFQQAQMRQYQRLTKNIKPSKEMYEKSKQGWDGDYSADNLSYGKLGNVTKEGVERMVNDLNEQAEKRKEFSRRRMFVEGADVNFINERNRRFNLKVERFYGKHTKDIKDSFERGTAI